VRPGDVVIYVQDGSIEHSGIVVWVDGAGPWILSKWGECHEPIHRLYDCPYRNRTMVVYYRLGELANATHRYQQ
jgi:hypothetical protein